MIEPEDTQTRRIVRVWWELFHVKLTEKRVEKHIEILKKWEKSLPAAYRKVEGGTDWKAR